MVFSGTTVAVGLLALIALPLPFLRSMGYGGLLIPLVATLAAITLLPVILATIGPQLDRRRIRRRDRSDALLAALGRRASCAAAASRPSSRWRSWSRCSSPATNLHLGNADPDTIAKEGSRQGRRSTPSSDSGIGNGRDRADRDAGAGGRRRRGGRGAGARSTASTARWRPRAPAWRKDGQALIVGRAATRATRPRRAATRSRTCIDAAHDASPDARVGGTGPLNADFIDAVYGSFPLMIALISIADVPAAGARVPLAAAAAQGGHPQHPVGGRGLGRDGARLAGGPRLRRDLGDRRHRLDRRRGSR